MKVITLQHPYEANNQAWPELVMALGFFDGVHLGHKEVIQKARELADKYNIKSAVMTFDPHPSVILGRDVQHVKYITPLQEKTRQIEKLGIDYLFVVEFSLQFAELLPQQFIDQYIIGLNVKHVVTGFDYTYGRLGKGTTETMPFHARNMFTQTIIPKKAINETEKISSTLIRNYIHDGKIDLLEPLLGRPYTINGIVVHGDGRGRTLGFPTANVLVTDDYLLPPVGVYAVQVMVNGMWYHAVCNVGYKPTFKKNQDELTVEAHLLDFSQDIYGEKITIAWHYRIRSEQKFSGVEQLVNQINMDKQTAVDFFKNKGD